MNAPIAASPPDVFNFLGLPSELRSHIYWLNLGQKGDVSYQTYDYQTYDDLGFQIVHDKPAVKPVLGVNISQVCKQIYHEAVMLAYWGRKWDLGTAPRDSGKATVDCAARLACIPHDTAEKIQELGLEMVISLQTPISFTSVAMGDLTKFKSLRRLKLSVFLESGYDHAPEWLLHRGDLYRNSPFLIGLVCQMLSQIPDHLGITWLSAVGDWDEVREFKRDEDMLDIAYEFEAIKGCRCPESHPPF
jgi:hypothetical protein